MIVGLGAYLLYQRWLVWRSDHPDHHHHHHHHHHPDEDHHHHHAPPNRLTWRALITLGISGGLVPCPDAIAILLVAIAINRIGLGLSLIVAFSLGLALVLIVIGLVMVHSRQLFDRLDTVGRLAPLMPVVSAVVVLLLGLGLTVNALWGGETFAADEIAIGQEAAPIDPDPATETLPSFNIDQAAILFVGRDADNLNQLFITYPNQETPQPLTGERAGITDFDVAANRFTVAYTAIRPEGGTDLYAINADGSGRHKLVDCTDATCAQPIWSPDDSRLVYQRLLLTGDASSRGSAPSGGLIRPPARPLLFFKIRNWPDSTLVGHPMVSG